MKAVAYCRYSSDNQRQESIDAQIRDIKAYAQNNNYELIKVYIDEAKSATTDNRPNFQKMIFDSNKNIFEIVLVHKLDRFARDRYDSSYYKRKLKNNGVRVISITEKLDNSPESVILESVIEGMSEYYSKNLARETMKGLKENAYSCKHTGGCPPFGYDIDESLYYVINKHEAIAVKHIFSEYGNGNSYKAIISWLKERGYKTKRGGDFHQSSLYSILKNEKYTGIYIYNKTTRAKNRKTDLPNKEEDVIRIEGGIPALIDKDTFLKTRKKLEENKKRSQSFKAKEIYLLSGLLTCGKCNAPMHGSRRKSGTTKTIWASYQCSNKKNKLCDMREKSKNKIEKLVIEKLTTEVFNPNQIKNIANLVYKKYQSMTRDSDNNINIFKSKLKEVEKQIDNIVLAIADGMYHSSMKSKLEELEFKKTELVSIILDEESKKGYDLSIDSIIKYLNLGKELANKPLEEQKRIIKTFVNQVTVYDDYIDIDLYVDTMNGERGI